MVLYNHLTRYKLQYKLKTVCNCNFFLICISAKYKVVVVFNIKESVEQSDTTETTEAEKSLDSGEAVEHPAENDTSDSGKDPTEENNDTSSEEHAREIPEPMGIECNFVLTALKQTVNRDVTRINSDPVQYTVKPLDKKESETESHEDESTKDNGTCEDETVAENQVSY